MNLQHLGCWNHLEKLAEMFLNTFHREHILLILKIKKLLRKIKSKNFTAGVFYLVRGKKTFAIISEFTVLTQIPFLLHVHCASPTSG